VKTKARKGRLRPEEFEQILTPERVRPVQVVLGAFLVSAAIVVAMTALARSASTEPRGLGLVQLLGVLGVVLWIGGYGVGFWLFSRRTSREALEEAMDAPFRGPASLAAHATEADKIASQLRRAWVARAASWGIGPVICLLSLQAAIQGNLAHDSSVVTTGIIPMASYAVLLLVTWPTRARQIAVLEKAFVPKSK
jgi:hypothetical protein